METLTHKVKTRCDTPVNRTAAIGMHRSRVTLKVMRECPTLHPVSFRVLSARLKIRKPDITGYNRGRITVIGFIHMGDCKEGFNTTNINDSQWAVQCDCGMYERRKYGNFLRGFLQGKDDCCDYCYDPNGPKHARTR